MAATSARGVSDSFSQIQIEEKYRKALYEGNLDEVERIFPQSKIGVANRFGKDFTAPYPLRIVISGLANAIFENRERPNTDILAFLRATLNNYLAVINFLLERNADPKLIFIVPVNLFDENHCLAKGEDLEEGFALVEKQLSPLSKSNIFDDLIKIHNGIAYRQDPTAGEVVGKIFKLLITDNENFSEKYGLQFIPRAKQELKALTDAASAHQQNAEELKQKAEDCEKRAAALLKQAEEQRKEAEKYRTELSAKLVQISSYQKETAAFQALLSLIEITNANKKTDVEETGNTKAAAIVTGFNTAAAAQSPLTTIASPVVPPTIDASLINKPPPTGGTSNVSAISAKK